jgi:hypothetical protein
LTEQKPPGWYPDTREPADFDRFWDGVGWSEQVRKAQEAGFVEQFRTLPRLVKLGLIAILIVAAILVVQGASISSAIETVPQAESRFVKWAQKMGIPRPLQEVECRVTDREDFYCRADEPGQVGAVVPTLNATVKPDGSILAVGAG